MKSLMASSGCDLAALILLIAALVGAADCAQTDNTALFVFGDSYADTGNNECAPSWQPPYGQTWPGVPAGRFSDGKLLTDYIASIMEIETPLPHRHRSAGLGLQYCKDFNSGINFAHGGSGVFTTYFEPQGPTLSCQIDQFQMISTSCPNIQSLANSSVALVVMVGNDYITFLSDHPDPTLWEEELPHFISKVVNRIKDSITRLYNIGFRKFAVANLEPAGCTPLLSTKNNTECNEQINGFCHAHNSLLSKQITEIRTNLAGINIAVLNQFERFAYAREKLFGNKLEACMNSATNTACSDPDNYFFWDNLHPTQAGWEAVVYPAYEEQIQKLIGMYNHGRQSVMRFQ